MFIQVIQGRCLRPDELRAHLDTWRTEVGESGSGWLGGTFGFTDHNQFIGVVRFESQDAAMANSERPEQGAWAEKMASLMDGEMEFHDCDDVTTFLDGGSDDAGFVQIIRGHIDDRSVIKTLLADTDSLKEMRPEIIGGTLAVEADGTFTQTVAFTDEASARAGESNEGAQPPAEIQEALQSMMEGAVFYDLHNPWFESA